jgi:hypothetical protein
MLDRVEGESLYSIIYRTHLLHGISDFSNILTLSGRWKKSPTILEGTIDFYQPINEKMISECLIDLRLSSISEGLFYSPVEFIQDINNFVYKNNKSIPSSHKKNHTVKYCLDCVKKNINDNGFAIHKQAWIKNDICSDHEKPLFCVTPISKRQTLIILNNIFKGEHTIDKFTISDCSKKSKIVVNNYSEINKERISLYFAPCLEKFLQKISPWKNDIFFNFVEETIKNNTISFSNKTEIKNLPGDFQYYIWMIATTGVTLKNFLHIIKNAHRRIGIVILKKGASRNDAFSFKIYKKKSRNCLSCKSKACPVKAK